MKKLSLILLLLIFAACSGDDDSSSLTWDNINSRSFLISVKAKSTDNENMKFSVIAKPNYSGGFHLSTSVHTEFNTEDFPGNIYADQRFTENNNACKVESDSKDEESQIEIYNLGSNNVDIQITYIIPTDGPKHIISFTLPAGETHIEDLPCRIENPETFFNQ